MFRQPCKVDQVLGMGHSDVGPEAAVMAHSESSGLRAQVVLSGRAHRAGAAANPGIHDPSCSDRQIVDVQPNRDDLTDDLMPENARQTKIGELQLSVVAKVEVPVH